MRIVIDGAGEVGSHLAKMLRAESNDIMVIDSDAQRLEKLAATLDIDTLQGSPSSLSVLKQAGVGKADLFIAVFPNAVQEINIVSAVMAKNLGAAKVIARISEEEFLTPENKLIFKQMGIELMFYPEKIAADEIVSSLKQSTALELMDFARGQLQIALFRLDENSPVLDLKLSEFFSSIDPAEIKKFRILAIKREDRTIMPKMETKFRFSDVVFTISTKDTVEQLSEYFGKTKISTRRAMILGGTPIACMVARDLSRLGISVCIIDKSKERCNYLSEVLPDSVRIINGDGRNSDLLYDEGISSCDAFIALTNRDEGNVLACVVAKKFGVPRTVAEVENIEYISLAEEMGVGTVINKKLITASRIFRFTLSGKTRFVRYLTGSNAELIEYTVSPDSEITKYPVKDLDFPKNAIICGVQRGSQAMIAVGDTRIEAYDKVAVFALPENLKEIDRFFK